MECAFGELVGRWGILWRTLRHDLPMATAIIQACARLHNWCLNHRVDNTGVSGWQATAAEKGDCDLGGNPLPIFGTTGALRMVGDIRPTPHGGKLHNLRTRLITHGAICILLQSFDAACEANFDPSTSTDQGEGFGHDSSDRF